MSDEELDDLDLASLPDDELVTQMHDDLYDGLADEIVEGTTILLDRGWTADKVLNDALVEGMRIVGIDFRDGILFVPEVLLAANAMKAGRTSGTKRMPSRKSMPTIRIPSTSASLRTLSAVQPRSSRIVVPSTISSARPS